MVAVLNSRQPIEITVDGAYCLIGGVAVRSGLALQTVLPMVREGRAATFCPAAESDIATARLLTNLAGALGAQPAQPRLGRWDETGAPRRLQGSLSPTLLVAVGGDADRAPSGASALQQFAEAANLAGLRVEMWDIDSGSAPPAEGAFLRTYTEVGNAAYRLAVEFEESDRPVIDAPESIRRGCNKIFQTLGFQRAGVPTPGTAVAFSADQLSRAAGELGGWPIVVKHPGGAFCDGIYLATSAAELETFAGPILAQAGGVVLQRFEPTSHDWRIGVLGGRPLYAARYGMAAGSWRLCDREGGGETWGEAFPARLCDAPPGVIAAAVSAAKVMGNSLWGVDVKLLPSGPAVIEVNDNPDLDEAETCIPEARVWEKLAAWFSGELHRRTTTRLLAAC